MLQDGVALGAELFGADGHGHLNVLDFPLGPCTAVHPDAAVLQPLSAGFLLQVDGGEDAVRADAVGAVRVGQVAGHEYLVRLHLAEQVADDFHVGLADGVLLDATRLIERQVEEVAVGQRDVVVRAGRACLAAADKALDGQDVACVDVAVLLLAQELADFLVLLVDDLVVTVVEQLVEAVDETSSSPTAMLPEVS